VQFAPWRSEPVPPHRVPLLHGSAVAIVRAAIVLAVCAAFSHSLPVADARSHRLGLGPAPSAYPLAREGVPALDPWGFVARQCTSYAAWYLNAHGVPFGVFTRGPGGAALFTSAGSWHRAAVAAGFAVLATPAAGTIAQWDPRESSPPARAAVPHDHVAPVRVVTAGRYGHVAVVRRVLADGRVQVSEYNGADGNFHDLVTRAPRYLYIGVFGGSPPRAAASAQQRSASLPGWAADRWP
jgi:surface antigen